MDPRILNETNPAARLAAVARRLVARMSRCSLCQRDIPPNKPDYADLREELEPWLEIELLKARLAEAKLPKNDARVAVLHADLEAAYFAASKATKTR